MLKFSDLPSSWPLPDSQQQAHCIKITQCIVDEIQRCGGRISFAQFMKMALYEPRLGYYSAGSQKLGPAGDFVTAPEISPLFSRCIARNCLPVLQQHGGNILELGAGSGVMAADILLELECLSCLPDRYMILELSADLQEKQQQTLEQRAPHLMERIVWLRQLPPPTFIGVVLANEVLDAMPVHRFRIRGDQCLETYVIWLDDEFQFVDDTCSEEALHVAIRHAMENITSCQDYVSEINLSVRPWMASLYTSIKKGAVILIDYGFPAHEYYHPERSEGTLMCHYRHRAHENPLILPGLQDITAHVDFTAVAHAGVDTGFSLVGFTSQAYFLMGSGLDEMMAELDPEDTKRYLNTTQQVKKLTLPHEMGELFKVIGFSKNIDTVLPGFALQDARGRL